MTGIAAALCGLGGIAALYGSWRKRLRPKWVVIAVGWSLIAVSLWPWTRYGGVEFGPVLAALWLSVAGLLFVLANRHVRRGNGMRRQHPERRSLPRLGAVGRHLAVFIVALPLAGVAAVLVLTAASGFLPWQQVDRIAFVLVLTPVLWGVLACWTTVDPQLLRPAIGIAAGASLAAALSFL